MKRLSLSRSLLRLLLISCVAALLSMPAGACPACKDAVAQPGEGASQDGQTQARVAAGYNWSILFMIAAPFTVVGGIGAGFYFALRKPDAVAAQA